MNTNTHAFSVSLSNIFYVGFTNHRSWKYWEHHEIYQSKLFWGYWSYLISLEKDIAVICNLHYSAIKIVINHVFVFLSVFFIYMDYWCDLDLSTILDSCLLFFLLPELPSAAKIKSNSTACKSMQIEASLFSNLARSPAWISVETP